MSALSSSLIQLLEFVSRQEPLPPSREVRIVEIPQHAPLADNGRIRVSRASLRTPAEYESRFEDLLSLSLPWINMSCYGVYNGFLIVGIELPGSRRNVDSVSPPSINYSGPQARVIEHDWNALEALAVE